MLNLEQSSKIFVTNEQYNAQLLKYAAEEEHYKKNILPSIQAGGNQFSVDEKDDKTDLEIGKRVLSGGIQSKISTFLQTHTVLENYYCADCIDIGTRFEATFIIDNIPDVMDYTLIQKAIGIESSIETETTFVSYATDLGKQLRGKVAGSEFDFKMVRESIPGRREEIKMHIIINKVYANSLGLNSSELETRQR